MRERRKGSVVGGACGIARGDVVAGVRVLPAVASGNVALSTVIVGVVAGREVTVVEVTGLLFFTEDPKQKPCRQIMG